MHHGPVIRADNDWRGTGSLKWQCV